MLILILLASFLNGAKSARALSPSPRQSPNQDGTGLANDQTGQNQPTAAPRPPFVNNQVTTPTTNQPAATNTPEGQPEQYKRIIERSSEIQAACAVALVIFTALLFCANRGMQIATQTAAKAAKLSADTAYAMLMAERPLLIAETFEMLWQISDTDKTTAAQFRLVNYGKRPAIIIEMLGEILIDQKPTTPIKFDGIFRIVSDHDAIAAEDKISCLVPYVLDHRLAAPALAVSRDRVEQFEAVLYAIGVIRYRDVHPDLPRKEPFETAFSVRYVTRRFGGTFYAEPPEANYQK